MRANNPDYKVVAYQPIHLFIVVKEQLPILEN
jgi:hypothetical protein